MVGPHRLLTSTLSGMMYVHANMLYVRANQSNVRDEVTGTEGGNPGKLQISVLLIRMNV